NYSPFWQSIRNILWWIVLTLVTQIPIGFLLANLFSSRFSGFRVFKAIVFLPQVISATVIGLLWYFVLRPDGVLNTTLTTFGAAALGRDWLVNPGTAMTSVILVNTWIGIGFHMTLFFAAISSIPDSILDSCKLDGITGARKLFRITVPLTWETLRVCLIIAITQSLRAFDLVFVMTEGGPNGLTDIPATLLYRESFRFQRFGVGSSIGVLILLISLIFTLISLRLLRRETVEY
ncbi:MAG TPA: sugar ABC transporter permease, partial [Spirochaetia bacterium]|nr:sugar ABC transporter permease [Spirochaetia bacterium]